MTTSSSAVAVTTAAMHVAAITGPVTMLNWSVAGVGPRKEKNRLVTPCTGGGGSGGSSGGGGGAKGGATTPATTAPKKPATTTPRLPANNTKMTTNEALNEASQFLGPGYKDMGRGRFVSADGTRQVRMGDSDILGHHGGGSHMNFEILTPHPITGKMQVTTNIHIYLLP